VPPLAVPPWASLDLGSGSAPHTARSAGSSGAATPRTGGGLTARSDGKGTPRDHERLPLGTLGMRRTSSGTTMEDRQRQVPRLMQLDRIGGLPETGSPGTTARSGAASSSSPGGCSSHGYDAWASGVYAQDLAAQGSLATPQASAVASLEQETALKNKEWVSDMSRELEVMRHVIQKEMSEMRRLWMEKKEALAPLLSKRARPARLRRDCWTQPMSSSSLSLETLEAQGLEPSSYLEWRIQGIEAGVAPAQHTFELPEHPEVSFCCTFGPWAENRESSDSPRSP
ncbi:unnamed protein product, partial [Polarella glacialis]